MEPVIITVGPNGEIEIPQDVGERLGVEPGVQLAVPVFSGEIVLKPDTLKARLRMIEAMRGITKGGPSMTDALLEERRRERERELREEGW
jgi:bifunctional DNA-binding transcriptional regulator/antitoxin component of YhaV-PrlF toxin-antitoxin module